MLVFMKLKTIKQHLKEFQAQSDLGQAIDLELVRAVKKALKDKKTSYKHKLRHGAHFEKRERAEKKLKKVKACLKQLAALVVEPQSEA
jgi:hypothetical protein